MNTHFPDPIEIKGNCYFASDFHLGSPTSAESRLRETKIVEWLDTIKNQVDYLFLLGDVFDFWFEYKYVIPKGYSLFFSKIKELRERNVTIFFFTGNHDMWVKNYLTEEYQMQIFRKQQRFIINGKRCLVGHGDGLGKGDFGYKFIKWSFACPFNIFLYGLLPSSWAFGLARFSSRKSRAACTPDSANHLLNKERKTLIPYIKTVLNSEETDYFIYGHWHTPKALSIEGALYFNTGDWLVHNSFLSFPEGENPQLFQI